MDQKDILARLREVNEQIDVQLEGKAPSKPQAPAPAAPAPDQTPAAVAPSAPAAGALTGVDPEAIAQIAALQGATSPAEGEGGLPVPTPGETPVSVAPEAISGESMMAPETPEKIATAATPVEPTSPRTWGSVAKQARGELRFGNRPPAPEPWTPGGTSIAAPADAELRQAIRGHPGYEGTPKGVLRNTWRGWWR